MEESQRKKKMILYLHGSRGSAWSSALRETKLIELSNNLYEKEEEEVIMVFGQAIS